MIIPASTPRRAFSMIELLVVVAIIGILAAMILTGAKALGIGSKKARTQTILAAVRKGLELTIANKGGSISPVEHPLAGSRPLPARFDFLRKDSAKGSVSSGGEALAGVAYENLSSSQGQLMLPDDIYNDKRSYLLFGMARERLGVLGAMQKRVTKYRLLPRPAPAVSPTGTALITQLPTPYDETKYPNTLIPTDLQDSDATYGQAGANKQALDYVFGSSNVQSELSALKALYMADPTTPENQGVNVDNPNNKFRYLVNVGSVGGSLPLLYTDGKSESFWKPGTLAMTGAALSGTGSGASAGPFTITTGGTKFYHYKLPGLALYDAWGNEVLYSISQLGGVRFQSAGEDGVFKVAPGDDHVIDTTDCRPTTPLNAKDKDGSRDNISQEVEE